MGMFIEDRLIRTLRVWTTYYTIWPLNSEDGKFKTLLCKFLWWLYTLNMLHIFLLIPSIFLQESYIDVFKILLETTYTLNIIICIIFARIRRKRILKLLYDIEYPHHVWTPREQAVRCKFMRRLHKFCVPLWIISTSTAVLYIFSPMVTDRELPLNTVHVFSISNFWVYCLAYIQGATGVHESHIPVFTDLIITVIMWHAAFKFHLLGRRARFVDTAEKLRAFIVEHQNVVSYVREIDSMFSIILFQTTIFTCIGMLVCSLAVLYVSTLAIK